MAIENVTRPTSDDGGLVQATLVCGKPACDEIATDIVEFEWNGWSGILGACMDHHEDLGVLALKAKASERAEPDENMPRD